MANDRECVVCGKPRFLIERTPYYFNPLVCSPNCAIELNISHGETFQFSHEVASGRNVAWTLGYERSVEDYLDEGL